MFAKKALSAAPAAVPVFIEDTFSSYLYTGNGSTQTITNNIDLSGEGGLVWIKRRDSAVNHYLATTDGGTSNYLNSNTTSDYETGVTTRITSFNADGFSLGSAGSVNNNTSTFCSWTFRKAEKFFDVVTFTVNSSGGATFSHSLGSTPGCIFIKRTDGTSNWLVVHRSLTNACLLLNTTDAQISQAAGFYTPTSTSVTFSNGTFADANSQQVAYLFAHDAGGFGEAGDQSVIKCGSFTATSGVEINLGWEPQFIILKRVTDAGSWYIFDNMRGISQATSPNLKAEVANAESDSSFVKLTATGFTQFGFTDSSTCIYIAIRRGPMKTPEAGTEVFSPTAYAGNNTDNRLVNTGIITDLAMARARSQNSTGSFYTADRLRGDGSLGTAITDAENTDPDSFMTPTSGVGNSFSAMNGFGVGNDVTRGLNPSANCIAYAFRRAPGFFDVVCYTGTGSATTVTHNLGVVPELMIVKNRSDATGRAWAVYAGDNTDYLVLNTNAATADDNTYWNDTSPTSTVFSVGTNNSTNESGDTFVAYLFASVDGVSKVGSYTGNGSSQTINCGFTAGARFILIKRTDSTGDWYVWDTARGIVSGDDVYLRLNVVGVEETYDAVDPDNSGFIVNNDATNFPINVNNATYIFYAVA